MVLRHTDVEDLLRESHRLREELMRTAAKLQAFSDQLLDEVDHLHIMEDDKGESHGDGPGDP